MDVERMKALLTQVVFGVGEHAYDWGDVFLAAKRWGDWAVLEEEVRQGLACVARLEDSDEELDPDQLTTAADEFRYDRDLVTAAETEAWLARWGLTTEAWMDYIERSVLRRELASEITEIVATYEIGSDEIADVIVAEGVCSGQFQRFAWKLAGRAAVYQRMLEERSSETAGKSDERTATTVEVQDLPGWDAIACQEKVAFLTRIESAFRNFREMVLSPQALRDAVRAHYLDWTRFHCFSLSLADEQTAQEAALCIREDGAEFAEVGRMAKTPVHEARFFLDETEPESRHAFMGAATGDLLGPLPVNGGFSLFQVIEKVLPSAEDPVVRERAEREVLEHAVEHEMTDRVRWRFSL